MPGTHFSVEVQPVLPERLRRLEELANDLYYSWDRSVRGLFRHLDGKCWESSNHNPKVFLRRVSQRRLDEEARDPMFLSEYRRALSSYDTYLEERPHELYSQYLDPETDLVAYFSAEFGFHQSIPIYAGGLGILAADYCKAMSHLRVPFVGVGMLYHEGYFTQRLECDGTQVESYPDVCPDDLPVTAALDAEGQELHVTVELPGRSLELKVWLAKVGHIRLYLLDSDVPANSDQDRSVTYKLYGGDRRTRIQQEIVLGVGGVRALRALGIRPTVWHINEGHSAFQVLERCREHVAQGMDFDTALELVASATVFTTHTPVPAGHDLFDHGLMREHFGGFIGQLGTDERRFLDLGASPLGAEAFNMTALAFRGSRFCNGVSRIHGHVASDMAGYIWPQIPVDENPVGHVTNGVDVSTFQGLAWASLFDMYLDTGWRARLTDAEFWSRFIDNIPDHVYQSVHQILKSELIENLQRRLLTQYRRGGCSHSVIHRVTETLNPRNLDTLVIGFARRFATYKRALLLFQDLERLARLVNDPDRPVIFVFAGKAHPQDEPGKGLIRRIAEISLMPEFLGKVYLLEDYNFSMARRLMPGVDVWLNVPEYPKEACGTSGMKAGINGAINLSVLDGWWGEAFRPDNGWAILPRPNLDSESRNREEAIELLNLLEQQVIPLYFQRNTDGEATGWIAKSKASMQATLSKFNSQRMALDYLRDYYAAAKRQRARLDGDNGEGARALSTWKKKVQTAWPGVTARLIGQPPSSVTSGSPMLLEVAIHLNGLEPDEVSVECVLGDQNDLGDFVPREAVTFQTGGRLEGGEALYRIDLCATEECLVMGGLEYYKIRAFPQHPMLSHRFEHGCMLWL